MGDVINPQTILEQIAYATVLIQTEYGSGTGFLLQKDLGNNLIIPLLVTNKHVIYGEDKKSKQPVLAEKGKLIFHTMNNTQHPSGILRDYTLEKHFGKHFFQHPNSDVDLCAMSLAYFVNDCKRNPPEVFVRYISTDLIPTEQQWQELDYMEEVFMVGYPNSLSDKVHNYPIVRRGVTATHPCIDFNGKKEFLADIPNFPGSSGSPLFLYSRNRVDKEGNICFGSELLYFLGVVYSVETSGVFVDTPEPTKLQQENCIRTAMNLAHVIKSSELFELLDLFPSTVRMGEANAE